MMQGARQLIRRLSPLVWTKVCRGLAPTEGLPCTTSFHSIPSPPPHDLTTRRGLWTGRVGGECQAGGPLPRPAIVSVASAAQHPQLPMLQVTWGDGSKDDYPYVWLRDNCPCPSCFHPVAMARTTLLQDLQLSDRPSSVQVAESGAGVKVTWQDGHLSTFPTNWLQERAFGEEKQQRQKAYYRIPPVFWSSEMTDKVPKASFDTLMEDDVALLKFLTDIEAYAVVIVTGTPTSMGQIHRLTPRVAHFVPTHYGETFCIMNKSSPSNLAYTSAEIDLHSDLPCRSSKPEVQLLHCIEQAPGEGGTNLLSDGVHAASRFRTSHPDKFRILSTTMTEFCDRGNDEGHKFHLTHRCPVIALNFRGEVETVNQHSMSRSSFVDAAVEDVTAWYDALYTFHAFLTDPLNSFYYKMQEGDILVMDNHRLLHSRTAFTSTAGGTRHLEGSYWAWPDVRSKRRILQQQLESL